MLSDPIGDMIARIRNGYQAYHQEVELPYSKIKEGLAKILVKEGFLKELKIKEGKKKKLLLALSYQGRKPAIVQIKRVSRPGRRTYVKTRELKPLLSGLGVKIVSTSQGLMTDKEARQKKMGGEVLCYVW